MNRTVFVEQLTPHGDVIHRHKLTQLPICIGRAYDNDIILDDPHTGAHHAQVELNQLDELIINEKNSVNGITRDNHRESVFVIEGDAVYRLGNTRLRIRTPDYQVAAEQTGLTDHRWDGLLPGAVGLFLLVFTGLLTAWLSDLNQGSLGKYLLELVSVVGFALGWSGIWAVFSNLFNGQARFGRHLFIVGCGLAGLELWDYTSSMLAYAFSWEILARFTVHPLIFICAIVLYFHLRTAGNKRPGRLKLYLIALALVGSIISITKQYQATNHMGNELYLNQLYPPALRISRDLSLTEFMADIDALQNTVDNNRKDTSEKSESAASSPSLSSSSTDAAAPDNP
jgi:hypothetical protein